MKVMGECMRGARTFVGPLQVSHRLSSSASLLCLHLYRCVMTAAQGAHARLRHIPHPTSLQLSHHLTRAGLPEPPRGGCGSRGSGTAWPSKACCCDGAQWSGEVVG